MFDKTETFRFVLPLLVGNSSQKVYSAIENWISEQAGLKDAPKIVWVLKSRLQTLNNTARIQKLTHFDAFISQDIGWKGKFEIVERLFRVEEIIFLKLMPKLDLYLSTASMGQKLQAGTEDFQKNQ